MEQVDFETWWRDNPWATDDETRAYQCYLNEMFGPVEEVEDERLSYYTRTGRLLPRRRDIETVETDDRV